MSHVASGIHAPTGELPPCILRFSIRNKPLAGLQLQPVAGVQRSGGKRRFTAVLTEVFCPPPLPRGPGVALRNAFDSIGPAIFASRLRNLIPE